VYTFHVHNPLEKYIFCIFNSIVITPKPVPEAAGFLVLITYKDYLWQSIQPACY